jgi:hypothetical protein
MSQYKHFSGSQISDVPSISSSDKALLPTGSFASSGVPQFPVGLFISVVFMGFCLGGVAVRGGLPARRKIQASSFSFQCFKLFFITNTYKM